MLIERQRFSGKFALAMRAAVVLAGAMTLVGCDTVADSIENFNPFSDKKPYKPEVVNDVPADQLYNDGLGRVANSDYTSAAKKFAAIDKQYPYTDVARKGL